MKTLSLTYRFIFFLVALVAAHTAMGQVNVTIRVLPPYQSRITEYASRPDLMLLTLTNTSTTAQRVQLTGSISGDNGVGAWVTPGYRSPQPIELAPGQALSLNGSDIAFLFDHNQIQYTGISQADFTRGRGLLEGTYQLCVRALDYDTHEPLSPEEPVGCTQLVISSVEPPTIIQPFNEQELRADGPQAFPITWSTPPGASPLTQYKVKLVEMITPRNPNDAMQSATTPPFFEETVNTNMLLYGPQYPQLTPGRQYALMVQAIDPYNTISFRNQGMSEVIAFTYGAQAAAGVADGESNPIKPGAPGDVAYATNTISGKLSWAFKASEASFRAPRPMMLAAVFTTMPPSTSGTSSASGAVHSGTFMQQATGTLASYYLGHNTLQSARTTALAQADPTLNKGNTVIHASGRPVNAALAQATVTNVSAVAGSTIQAADIISSSGSKTLAFDYETVALDTGAQRYPLANIVVTIRGMKSPPSPQGIAAINTVNRDLQVRRSVQRDIEVSGLRTVSTLQPRLQPGAGSAVNFTASAVSADLTKEPAPGPVSAVTGEAYDPLVTTLATGRSDAEGNFTLQLLHPEYEGKNPYERIVVSVQSPGFEPYEYELPWHSLDRPDINLGEITLLARTYRFHPKIHFEKPTLPGMSNPGMRVTVYREAADLDRYPYLRQEGMLDEAAKTPVTLHGKQYVPIAVDSVAAGGDFLSNVDFKMARIFYQGSLYVEMEGLAGNVTKKTTTLRITDPGSSASRILQVKPEYEMRLARPSLSGQVVLQAGENMVPIEGAVLQVTYNPEDVEAETMVVVGTALGNASGFSGAATATITSTAVLQHMNVGNTNATNGGGTVASPSMAATAAVLSPGRVAAPVMVSAAIGQSGNVQVSPVLAGDGGLTEQQLREKYGPYTVKTDEAGQYLIGNLPLLKEGATYTVKIVNLPYNYRNMAVTPGTEQVFSATRGVSETRSFSVTPEVFNLVGRIVDGEKNGIPWARVHFKGSSSYFETGESGLFQTSFYEGDHTLVVEKEGYITLEFPVKLGGSVVDGGTKKKLTEMARKLTRRNQVAPGEDVMMNSSNPGLWVQSMQATQTVRNAVAGGEVFSPALFGFASNHAAVGGSVAAPQLQGGALRGGPNHWEVDEVQLPQQQVMHMAFELQVAQTFNLSQYAYASPQTTDLGDIGPMLPRLGKVHFTVVEKGTNTPVPGADIQLFDTTQVTDAGGKWLYEGFGGQATVTVTPPADQGLVTLQRSIQIDETGRVTDVRLELEVGVRLHGRVTGGGENLEGARVTVEGRDYLQTETDADGRYAFFLPAGEQVIRVGKSGYVAAKANRTIQPGGTVELDFNLQDGGGRDISTLLGFAIELDKIVPDGSGEKWSGRFVDLKPASALFADQAPASLSFANVKVTFDAQGKPIPEGNAVQTDVSSIPLKLFGFLPVILQGDQQIRVKGDAEGHGMIEGKLRVDVGRIQGSRGFTLPAEKALYIGLAEAGAGVDNITVFHAQPGEAGGVDKARLVADGAGEVSMGLYGFSLALDLSASSIGVSGLDLVGSIRTPALGPIGSMDVAIERFSISKELRIQSVKVKATDLPSLKIASWSASLSTLLFNENGFKVGGRMQISLPQSGESTVEFTNLSLGKDALYGGQFSFPGSGFNVYNIVKLTTGGKPLSFGRVGNTQVYSLSGSGKLKFDKLITREITIPAFQVQTDGRFMLQAPVNYSADLAFASFKIKTLTVSTLSGQAPFISVQGEFGVSVPGLKFEMADIRFKAAAGGGMEFSVGTIAGELEVPVVEASVRVSLADNGFSGGGKLSIPGTPINAEIDFHYYKVSGGVDFGAGFKAGMYIPLGIVEITKIGGGFSYNTANKQFMININGAASVTGFSTLVSLDPLSLTVESRGVVKGEAGVKIASSFELARAKMELNFPGKFFSVNVDSDIEPMKGVLAARMHSVLRIKWDPDDPYAFFGTRSELDVIGIVKNYSDFALGVNIRNPATRSDDISGYFRKLDADLYGGGNYQFSGAFLSTSTFLGIRNEDAVGIDFGLVSGKAWFYSTSDFMLLLNFGANDYRFRVAGALGGGAEGCVGFSALKGCITIGFDACYRFTGGYSDGRGWFLGGKAAVVGEAGLGCSDVGCNSARFSVIPPCVGAKLCLYGHANFDISARDGISLGVGLGTQNDGNQCN